MRRILSRIFSLVIAMPLLAAMFPLSAYAEGNYSSNLNLDFVYDILDNETSSGNMSYLDRDYVIDEYDIDMVVNENNTFDITEKITAYFHEPKHGIKRNIPLRNTITRLDGSNSTNRARITNLSVDNEYTTSKEADEYIVKIGSASKTITGKQAYTVKYTYNIGKDPAKEYDELYYNLIGDEWDTVIRNVKFSITMPREFDKSKLGFSAGLKGSTGSTSVEYIIDGNKITGEYRGVLQPSEALTVRMELPEGYFVGAGLVTNIAYYVMFAIPVVFLAIAVLLWFKFGRDDQVVETVEFYPPEELNSLDVGFAYKGKADNQDVTSLLIYLANKGYIKISESKKKSIFSGSDFKITKLKDYDGSDDNERLFLEGLFRGANNTSEVTSSDLYDSFYITMNKILSAVNKKSNKDQIFDRKASRKKIFVGIMIAVTYLLITIPPLIDFGDSDGILFALLFPYIAGVVIYVLLAGSKNAIAVKIFALVWGGFFGGVPWVAIVLPCVLQDVAFIVGYGVGLACIVGMIICLIYLPKRTSYGNELFGKLRGFKNFLETAEKEKLEAMVEENPTYFYDILPYTYVLGVSDKWIKKFESISLRAPDWYDSPNGFDSVSFGSFMSATMLSARSAMSSSPSSGSSGGGSSGGGSSGGGSGGGGGGSW